MSIDWTHFEHKIASGKTLDEAAIELGLNPDFVRERYNHEREATSVYGLEAVGSKAIAMAVGVLAEVMQTSDKDQVRVDAAGHLLKFATAALRAANDKQKIAVQTKTNQNMLDLFDVVGDWNLKKPGV